MYTSFDSIGFYSLSLHQAVESLTKLWVKVVRFEAEGKLMETIDKRWSIQGGAPTIVIKGVMGPQKMAL